MSELFEKCLEIRNKKWLKAVNNDGSGIGLTLEKQFGKEIDSFEIPDYNGIELKAQKLFAKSRVVLFSAVPDSVLFTIKLILERYGYPDKDYPQFKVFSTSVFAHEYKSMSRKYYLRLYVNYEKKCVTLNVYNRKYELIDNEIAWTFDSLQEKLERKLRKVLIARCYEKIINGEKYYYYSNFEYYVLKSFETFLKAIETGKICVNFKISVHKNEKYFGKIHNRGTTFDIGREDLEDVFKLVMCI